MNDNGYSDSMNCTEARPLVPAYVDGELGEARAGLLRKHLLGCQPCRASAQDGKALKRWFTPLVEATDDASSSSYVPVPSGFASRIARRAFAGDTGERDSLRPVARARGGDVLPFLLRATALAAGLLFAIGTMMALGKRPEANRLSADDATPLPVERVLDELGELNRADGSVVAQPEGAKRAANAKRNATADAQR